MIAVIDYNVGNVRSVCNALDCIGCQVKLSNRAEIIEAAAGLVLPGVAAFGYAVEALGGVGEVIKKVTLEGKPLLGICVGYQLLFDESSEYGRHSGLGLVCGSVVAIGGSQRVPHMGWNLVQLPGDMELFNGLGKQEYFYFAHSFYSQVTDSRAKVAYTDYGFALPASVQKANVYGVQFHPEKSGKTGLRVLQNFARIAEKAGS